jgi:hypothetical protein
LPRQALVGANARGAPLGDKRVGIDDLDDARVLREDADYQAKFSQVSAGYNLKAARRLIARISDLLAGWDANFGSKE